jgi:hypothetical protein
MPSKAKHWQIILKILFCGKNKIEKFSQIVLTQPNSTLITSKIIIWVMCFWSKYGKAILPKTTIKGSDQLDHWKPHLVQLELKKESLN